LRKRVRSYFRSPKAGPHASKTDFLVRDIRSIDVIETHSEAEALILEASLIKKYKPKYNITLRDDKTYPFIEITPEKFPRILIVRPTVKTKDSLYFGPYINPRLIREALSILRKIFPFRTCHPFPSKECLDYHLGLCDAPCIANISKKEYAKNIRIVRLILEGKKDQVLRRLQKNMETAAKARRYEQAAKSRDQLRALGALFSGTGDVNYFKEAEQLQRAIGLVSPPTRIEAFDISNIMGEHSVGSMVSFFNGRPDKANYRRFRIKEVDGIDDFAMMAEVVRRRYRRLKKEGALYPDLIIVDGGKGQLSAACEQLQELEVDIPIISLAKREEEVFLPNKRKAVVLAENSLGLQLLQRLRDEAHRFAVAYHRKVRGRNFIDRQQATGNKRQEN